MVFHDIESITDVLSGHRIIIYYIEGKNIHARNDKLIKVLGTAMGILEKKNDDLLIVKVKFESYQFSQFQELYNAEVTGAITLFVINNEGIPLLCVQINEEDSISKVITSLSVNCQLNYVPTTRGNLDRKHMLDAIVELSTLSSSENHQSDTPMASSPNQEVIANENHFETSMPTPPDNVTDIGRPTSYENETDVIDSSQPLFTELQIRLPNGTRENVKFNKDAMLQEVWILISTKYKLKDFDLKTYYRPAFSEEEYERTLQYLGLYPNGVIIVVNKSILPFNYNGGISGIVQYSYRLVINKTGLALRYMQGLLFMFWNSFFPSNSDDSRSRRQLKSQGGNRHTEQSSSGGAVKKSSRTFGNIHTLSRNDDSDDENNRYNGNSTQQK